MSVVTYGSVCSGVEAATVAWHPLGMIPTWFAEIDAFPSAVLAHRYPGVINLGDMTSLAGHVHAGVVHAPTVLVGGTPCQAFSAAGLRRGLTDPRGELTIKYVELLNELDIARTTTGRRPTVAVWENVPGVLSSNDNAFGCFLGALAGEDSELQPPGGKWRDAGCVFGPQRAIAWRVLDAQYFGLAQRRRRVFVVASARSGFDPHAVLFESEGVRRDTAPCRGEGEVAANATAIRTANTSSNGWGVSLEGPSYTLDTGAAGQCVVVHGASHQRGVRRITPDEAEVLQGFSPGYTCIPIHKDTTDKHRDGLRYKALGNSMAVPVIRWIGIRLLEQLNG